MLDSTLCSLYGLGGFTYILPERAQVLKTPGQLLQAEPIVTDHAQRTWSPHLNIKS